MKQQPVPARIPETMGPEEIGPHLRSLREQFKLTPQDVSERLHIRVRYVNAIEEAKYENMPGKVYARGYVHTYAEFLGLDPEQVVTQCFPATITPAPAAEQEAAPAAKTIIAAPYKNFVSPHVQTRASSSRRFGIGGIVVGALLIGYLAFSGGSSSTTNEAQEESTVAPVPESMLASVRNEIMPNAHTYNCIITTNILSCFFAQETVQQLQQLQQKAIHPFAEDLTGVIVVEGKASEEAAKEPEAVKVPEAKPAEIAPAAEAGSNEPQ